MGRSPTNTPLQALVTLNDPVYLEAAMHFAKNQQREKIENTISEMYQKATFRDLEAKKMETLLTLFYESKKVFEADPDQLKDFFGLGEAVDATTASLAIVANAIMNLDEFLTHG